MRLLIHIGVVIFIIYFFMHVTRTWASTTTTARPLEETTKPSHKSHSVSVESQEDQTTCGYESCPKPQPGKLNVHLVPHTHDDVGWLKTVDQYYYGCKNDIQKAGVQYIIDSVVRELLRDPQKKFIYVETAFWWKWWMKQTDVLRHQVKRLVNNGQLEFIGGGWSMNDEAVTNYQSVIDQMTWGFRRLNDTFGKCGQPRIGWQIDPFGHSRETASMFAQMGFEGLLFGRLDYQDKLNRLTEKTAEMIWKGSVNLGKAAYLFTSVLFNNYSPPPGFCFDILCQDEPFIDDKNSPDHNVDRLVEKFINHTKTQAASYMTNNIIMTMGEDFNYQDAAMWFKNLDKLIRYVNANGSNVNVFYSTPSCYIKAVHDAEQTWTTKEDDFFPYASDAHSYWTGYFTSRPTLKRFERMGNNFLQVCKQLYSLTDLGPEDWVDLNRMREAMGIMQHHDAVTGTEKQKVASDYARILTKGFNECDFIAETAINKIISKSVDPTEEPDSESECSEEPRSFRERYIRKENGITFKSCLLLNISQCDVSESSKQFVVTVYNPLSRPISQYVRFPVSGPSYTVQDPKGKQLKIQMVPISQPVIELPGRVSPATMELVFRAEHLPPLGFRSYYVSTSNSIYRVKKYKHSTKDIIMGRSRRSHFVLDKTTGSLKTVVVNGVSTPVTQDFLYYKGSAGSNMAAEDRASGAYIFRPNGTKPIEISKTPKYIIYKGDLVDETHIKYTDWVSQVLRFYHQGVFHSEMEWLVGPIPINDSMGKEIISHFSTGLQTQGLFYTDSNGREMLERKRNYRPTWSVKIAEPVAGNYYPVTSKISIRDEKVQITALTDRSQGGSSLENGEFELMLHRRLLHDDAFGVDEALNETAFGRGLVAIGKHYLTAGTTGPSGTAFRTEHDLAQQIMLSPWLFFSPADNASFAEWVSNYNMEFSGLTRALPENVQILTLEPWKAHTFLLRLEHVFEKNEDIKFSTAVKVNLTDVFTPFSISSIRETTLGANQWLSEAQRFHWMSESNEIDSAFEEDEDDEIPKSRVPEDPLIVSLTPMQIRTFVIEIQDKA